MWDECVQGPNPISFSFRQSIWLTVLQRNDSMVSKKVVRFSSKVAVQGYSFLCFGKVPIGAKAYIKTVGSEAYVQLPTFGAVNEGYVSAHVNVSWKVYGVVGVCACVFGCHCIAYFDFLYGNLEIENE